MKVLITGGLGFIGSNLAWSLHRSGFELRIVDNGSNASSAPLPGNADLVRVDLCNLEALTDAARGVSAIVHLAALGSVPRSIADPHLSFQTNAVGTLNVLNVARQQDVHVIFSSSSSVYGRNNENPKNEMMWVSPMSPYAASKLAAESLVGAFGESYGLDVLAFRFFNVFGPWQRPDHVYAAVVPKWLWRAIHRQAIPVDGDGLQSRDFTSVHTVTDVLVDAVERRVSHPTPVNLAYGNSISLLTLKTAIEDIIGGELEIQPQPPRTADVQVSQNDPALLKELFPGVEPRSFESTLRETYEWLLSQRGLIPPPQ